MEQTEHLAEYTTFIVRVATRGIAYFHIRVRTGEKMPFHGLGSLGRAVASFFSGGFEGDSR